MAKRSARDEKKKPAPKPRASAVKFIEQRFGFFLNVDQIVSVRVLPQQGDETYAMMQLSNGEKLNLTVEEFMAVTGKTRARRCGSGRSHTSREQVHS